jgi:hypothetical protein
MIFPGLPDSIYSILQPLSSPQVGQHIGRRSRTGAAQLPYGGRATIANTTTVP